MRMIDTCGYIGNWPFRRLTKNTAEEVDQIAVNLGADTMLVASSDALFYKNPQDGNKALYEALKDKKFTTKFLPMAVIRPGYPGWKRDIDTCIKEWGFFGIELSPQYHDFAMASDGAEVYRYASELGVPIRINAEFENSRQHHRLDDHRPMFLNTLMPMLNAGDAPVILNGYVDIDPNFAKFANDRGNIFMDIIRFDSFAARGALERFVDAMGTDMLCFGSRTPFSYGDGTWVKLAFAKCFTDEDREKIAWKNISKIVK